MPHQTPPTPPGARPPSAGDFDPAILKSALKAFKKRLKMARLDDESRLGHGPLSSGGQSSVVAIVPPHQFPQSVWDELFRLGKLRRAGQGLYELVGES